MKKLLALLLFVPLLAVSQPFNSILRNVATTNAINGTRTLPFWINVKDPPYNAVLDGATDDSVAIQTAVNTVSSKRGGIVYIPGPAKFGNPTILVTNDNITFLGQTPNLNDSAASTNFWIPASITSPMITFGNGTSIIKGGGVSSATFHGTSGTTNGQTAIRFAGNSGQLLFNSTFVGFRTNLLFLPSGSQPVFGVRMMGGRLHPHTSDTNQALVYLKMPDNQSPFVTDIVFDSVKVSTPQTIGSAGFLVDGTTISIINSYIDQGATNSSLRLRQTGTGQLVPFVGFTGSTLDPVQTNWVSVLEDVSAGRTWESYVRGGLASIKGRLQVSDGTQVEGPGSTIALIPFRSLASSIKIDSELVFDDGTSTAQWPSASTLKRTYASGNDLINENPQGAYYITSSNNVNLRSTNGISLVPLGNVVSIGQGNLQMSNTFGVQFGGTNATQETALGQTTANNVQLSSPTSGGSIQLTIRNPSNLFQMLFGANKLVEANSNSFNITSNKLTVGGNQVYPLNPGANVTFTTNADGTVTVAATGGAGNTNVLINGANTVAANFTDSTNIQFSVSSSTITAKGTNYFVLGGSNTAPGVNTISNAANSFGAHLTHYGADIFPTATASTNFDWATNASPGQGITTNASFSFSFINDPPASGSVGYYTASNSSSSAITITFLTSSTNNFFQGEKQKILSRSISGNSYSTFGWSYNSATGTYLLGIDEAGSGTGTVVRQSGGTTTNETLVTPSGVVTSVTSGHGLQTYSGTAAITSSDTAEIGFQVNAQSGTTYTVTTNDWGKMVTTTNASAIAVTLPQATSTTFQNGFVTMIRNIGPGLVTITPTTSKIDNATTITLANGFGAIVVSDGANYWTKGLPYNGVDLTTAQTLTSKTLTSPTENTGNYNSGTFNSNTFNGFAYWQQTNVAPNSAATNFVVDLANPPFILYNATNDIFFLNTTNRPSGQTQVKQQRWLILAGAANRNLQFSTTPGWRPQGGTVLTAQTILAGKSAVVTFDAADSVETNVTVGVTLESGVLYANPVNKTNSAYTIVGTDSSTIFDNQGSTVQNVFTISASLPQGFVFTVSDTCATAGCGMKVTCAAGETIRMGGSLSTVAGSVTNATGYSTFTKMNSTNWNTLSSGTWTVQ